MRRLKAAMALLVMCAVVGCSTDGAPLARVRHQSRLKIVESNNVSLRPGSVYDIITYFESHFGLPHPPFLYEFIDTGLGTAEPLYPNYQEGWQIGWPQLLKAYFKETFRHIDHFSQLETKEGCLVTSLYMLRHMTEFPELFAADRARGYDKIVIRLDHYERLRADAECGRHAANDADDDFDPLAWLHENRHYARLADFPQEDLHRFDASVSVIRHLDERFVSGDEHRRFDRDAIADNTLWYYPESHAPDYGLETARPQAPAPGLALPRELVFSPPPSVREEFGLEHLLDEAAFAQLLAFLHGEPVPGYAAADEPGGDTLNLGSDDEYSYIYTAGLHREEIRDVSADIGDRRNFELVSVIVRPYEYEEDVAFEAPRVIPQIRFVYQLMDPRQPGRPLEQLYLHLNYDALDRLAPRPMRDPQHAYFLRRVKAVAAARDTEAAVFPEMLTALIDEFTRGPLENLSFSSSLTGLWVFGALSTTNNDARRLAPERIVRDGVDVGYYSTIFDNDLFREAMRSTGDEQRRARLEALLADLTVDWYHDEKRHDVRALRFDRLTCAQCHHMAGRDAVHVALNDGLDRRFASRERISQYVFRELDRQLEFGQRWWDERAVALAPPAG